jgi:hypothetical protein
VRRVLAAIAAIALLTTLGIGTASASATRIFQLTLTGDQEVTATCAPPEVCGDPDASARMILIVNPNTDTVCFLTRWQDIDGTVFAAHIHNGPAGTIAAPVVTLFTGTFGGSGQLRGCVPGGGWTDDIIADPTGFYVNIHSTPDYPGGAVRAQLA